jgi:hypothetical protein
MTAAIRLSVSAFALGIAACAASEPPSPDLDSTELSSTFVGPSATCPAPVVVRFPVSSKHNLGYDASWNDFRCNSSLANNGFHSGHDIWAVPGTAIVAASAGTVGSTFTDPSGGNVVYIVDDCGWTHYYAHLAEVDPGIRAKAGQRVPAGTRVGSLGNTGNAAGTEPHLHYATYNGVWSSQYDPYNLLVAVEKSSCKSGNACSCIEGINVDGYSIGVPDTDCGHRVCGLDGSLFECQGPKHWTQIQPPGTCDGSCTCTGGRFKDGREIPAHMTHCKYRVCGMTNTEWRCTASGWKDTGQPCG